MKIIEQHAELILHMPADVAYSLVESAGRTCYKSECKGNAEDFVEMLIERGHESVLEHVSFTVRFTTDRGVSHELVRHRIASFSQESTRYCNYSKDKFDGEVTFIQPVSFPDREAESVWYEACVVSEDAYLTLIEGGATPQIARSVLNNSLKTEVVMTANIREWRHFLKLRTSRTAHPQMRDLAEKLMIQVKREMPAFFKDILVV